MQNIAVLGLFVVNHPASEQIAQLGQLGLIVIRDHDISPAVKERVWTPEDTRICEDAIAGGKAINIATGQPLTFEELQGLHDEYGKVKGTIDGESFMRDRVRAVPFEDGFP